MVSGTDSVNLKLHQSMTLADAKEFYESTKQMLEGGKTDKIWIDAVENEVIDLSILQILACVVARANENGAEVVWDNPSIALFERSVELGMDTALGL